MTVSRCAARGSEDKSEEEELTDGNINPLRVRKEAPRGGGRAERGAIAVGSGG